MFSWLLHSKSQDDNSFVLQGMTRQNSKQRLEEIVRLIKYLAPVNCWYEYQVCTVLSVCWVDMHGSIIMSEGLYGANSIENRRRP